MPDPSPHATEIAELVLQLGRSPYANRAPDGLTQAQWMALRFFARANRFSRNVSGFAAFHATTRGTASQTVRSLVDKGYLSRRRSPRDGRSVQFDLTPLAADKLAADPLENIVRAAAALSRTQQTHTAAGLRAVLGEFEKARTCSRTGVCRHCGHLQAGDGTSNRCRLMNESLDRGELDELCVRHQARA
ncbi:MAG: MarR family transcriptional regulator [Gammaproteobacteria bacterium]